SMNNNLLLGIGTVGVILVAIFVLKESTQQGAIDHKNTEYVIGGTKVKLTDGVSGGTRYFGNEVIKDLNGDGREDVAFLLTQDNGGSGTFYYVVAALNTEKGYVGSEGFLLGDRIAPQTSEIRDGLLIVNYAERGPNEPMTARPSFGKSAYLKLNTKTMKLEVVR
ncbi:MAG: hypothetical protein AAB561_00535, partial [Patescibacteria group bacterium]